LRISKRTAKFATINAKWRTGELTREVNRGKALGGQRLGNYIY